MLESSFHDFFVSLFSRNKTRSHTNIFSEVINTRKFDCRYWCNRSTNRLRNNRIFILQTGWLVYATFYTDMVLILNLF